MPNGNLLASWKRMQQSVESRQRATKLVCSSAFRRFGNMTCPSTYGDSLKAGLRTVFRPDGVFLAIYLSILPFSVLLRAAEPSATLPELAPDKVDLAVQKGVSYLIQNQNRTGYFQEKSIRSLSKTLALTSLSLMALASVGHMPSDYTAEGKSMERGLNFILRPGDNSRDILGGYFGKRDGSQMYGHGITTLALTELLGMGKDRAQDNLIRDRSIRGIKVILKAQKARKSDRKFLGGWRYSPTSNDSDLSVSVWQLMALRSANNAGLQVPPDAIKHAVGYLRRSYYSQRDNHTGRPLRTVSGFGYMPDRSPSYAMTAAGMLALQVVGGYRLPEVEGAAKWLLNRDLGYDEDYFFYGSYYYSQAMKKQGGEYAKHARRLIETVLLSKQQSDGSWIGGNPKEEKMGRVYGTAFAILCLSVKHGFLPIYQD